MNKFCKSVRATFLCLLPRKYLLYKQGLVGMQNVLSVLWAEGNRKRKGWEMLNLVALHSGILSYAAFYTFRGSENQKVFGRKNAIFLQQRRTPGKMLGGICIFQSTLIYSSKKGHSSWQKWKESRVTDNCQMPFNNHWVRTDVLPCLKIIFF